MSTVQNLEWDPSSSTVGWVSDNKTIRKSFSKRVGSAVLLRDQSGVLIVEGLDEKKENAAAMFNADGSERFRLENPFPRERNLHFFYAHYVTSELTVVFAGTGEDYACVLDEKTGRYLRTYETR